MKRIFPKLNGKRDYKKLYLAYLILSGINFDKFSNEIKVYATST